MLGFSAGGHLAAVTGTANDGSDPMATDPVERRSCWPEALVLGYPLISLLLQQRDPVLRALLPDQPGSELWRELSAETRVTADTPPPFLWHAADDQLSVEHSLLFAEALRQHGVPFALHVFATGGHDRGLAHGHMQLRAWTALCARWLEHRGFR